MIKVRKFSKQEILEIVAREAVKSIPDEKKGIVEARHTKDGSIEVYFLEYSSSATAS